MWTCIRINKSDIENSDIEKSDIEKSDIENSNIINDVKYWYININIVKSWNINFWQTFFKNIVNV